MLLEWRWLVQPEKLGSRPWTDVEVEASSLWSWMMLPLVCRSLLERQGLYVEAIVGRRTIRMVFEHGN